MKTKEEILKSAIAEYNRTAHPMDEFNLNRVEITVFTDAMEEHLQQFITQKKQNFGGEKENALNTFIEEVKNEFKDQNWDYLDFIKERVLRSTSSEVVEKEGWVSVKGRSIIEMEAERMEWALKMFPQATAISSLRKLEGEIMEVENDINTGAINSVNEEYADCLMCLFDSAGRLGITPQIIFEAYEKKIEKNKNRTWVKNDDNTYSHVKPLPQSPPTL